MNYLDDKRVVLTLDAGGTNFVFSAMKGGKEIVSAVTLESNANDLDKCLETLVRGFTMVKDELWEHPVAISFAFPGPADYENGVIGDLPNFPSFRGGIALGPFLSEQFNLPVYINNDGNLFAYGEAMAGALPEINNMLAEAKNAKRYHNLIGVTLGTGFGCGVTINGNLLLGDNGSGGDIWVFRNNLYPSHIAEESVSIRAIQRIYGKESGDITHNLSPKDIYDIAKGEKEGNALAAKRAFYELGNVAGEMLAQVTTVVDGVIVIGGGVAGAADLFMPSIIEQLNSTIKIRENETVPRMQSVAYYLGAEDQKREFLSEVYKQIHVPHSDNKVFYNTAKRTPVVVSSLGANKAIALGAYIYALAQLDLKN